VQGANADMEKAQIANVILPIKIDASMFSTQYIHDHLAK
jgi:hypothetical protein